MALDQLGEVGLLPAVHQRRAAGQAVAHQNLEVDQPPRHEHVLPNHRQGERELMRHLKCH